MVKYFISLLCILFLITSSDPHFGAQFQWNRSEKNRIEDVKELPWMSQDSFKIYLRDHKNRVSDLFPVSDYFYPTVNFWFLIYTQFGSNHVVIHDKNNLKLIYKVLDFSTLYAKGLPKNSLYILQNKIAAEKISELKQQLAFLEKDPYSLGPQAKNIHRLLTESGVIVPINKMKRKMFFQRLRENMRTQTGQRNFIKDGIVRSLPYKPFLNKFFNHMKLPPELLAIPFLESSFNPKAESKVGALGVWQFMPLIASYYVPKRSQRPEFDYRSNVGVISVAAAYLMKENIQLMKSWDLAVTAYNSGTKHLIKTKRELASTGNTINLEDIIRHSDSQHFGFASKNFYGEFLALVHALAYEEELFDEIHQHDRYNVEEVLHFHLTKCSMRFDKILNEKQLDDVLFHNHHITTSGILYPRATIVTSKEVLPQSKFLKLDIDHMSQLKPKEWERLLARQSCSTR